MKRVIIFIGTVIFVFLIASPLKSAAESDFQSEINRQVDDILSDYEVNYSYSDIKDISPGSLWEYVKNSAVQRIEAPAKVLKTLLIVIVFTAVVRSAGESLLSQQSSLNMYNMVCVMSASAVIIPQVTAVYSETLEAIGRTGGFILVYVPTFAAVTAAAGRITSAGIYNVLILGASELLIEFSDNFLLPVLTVTIAFAVCGSVFSGISLDSISVLLKKVVTWGLTIAMTLFTGFVSMKCTLGAKADSAATKTVKLIISGAVPVVGGAVSDAYSTVKSGFDVIHGTVGMAGSIAIILIMLPPILNIIIFRLVMWIGTAAAELFSVDSVAKLLKGLDSGLAIAQSVLVCHTLIFVLCTGILMKCIA